MTGDGEELVCRRVVEDREVIEELERIAVMVRSDKFLMKLRLGNYSGFFSEPAAEDCATSLQRQTFDNDRRARLRDPDH
jgi:hypothetical protein